MMPALNDLGKPPPFGGEEDRWPERSFSARDFFIAAGLAHSEMLRKLAVRDSPVSAAEGPEHNKK